MINGKRVLDTHLHMAQLMTPNDANILGKVFGGSILSLIDLTASACASKFSGKVCVTASFDRVDFVAPVEIGQMVDLFASINYVGRTSMEVAVIVHASDLRQGTRQHVNSARVTMVALEDGRPVPVPRLICETREEKLAFIEGRVRREIRGQRMQELKEILAEIATKSDEELEALATGEGSLLPLR